MNYLALQPLGWNNYFQQQLSFDELNLIEEDHQLIRITAIHRNRIVGQGEQGEKNLLCPDAFQPVSQFLAVGDWVLVKQAHEHCIIVRIIAAKNRIQRLAANARQVIAANLDYLWIVTSANDEFNLNRLQRYLALAYEFEIEPVIILTKTDLCQTADEVDAYFDQMRQLQVSLLHGISVNQPASLTALKAYFKPGNTIALLGSSGVGKSTLINAISKGELSTQDIRGDDKGRHTTTHRQLIFCENNVAIIDTPGMRELQLLDAEQGLTNTFKDIVELAAQCKFNNCHHGEEPACAVQAALVKGEFKQSHFDNFKKLLKETAFVKRRELGAYAQKQHQQGFTKTIKDAKKIHKYQ
ncbi:MAG: ribosome small subunit-dependent GTPase A [Pseudomonadales bacterium]|nr:ribosome small subunit-dependent GTPase A [Pseudomonadales bacterium]